MVFVLVAVYDATGIDPARDAALGALAFAVLTGVLSIGGVVYGKHLDRIRSLPRADSAVRKPMSRLAEAEAVLADLLDQLDDRRLPPDWVDRTRHAVANTSHQVRALAARIEAGERAIDRSLWRWERETLAESAVELHGRLSRTLDGYDRLIVALGRAVADSFAPPALDALTEATEHLAGLAEALRALRDHGR